MLPNIERRLPNLRVYFAELSVNLALCPAEPVTNPKKYTTVRTVVNFFVYTAGIVYTLYRPPLLSWEFSNLTINLSIAIVVHGIPSQRARVKYVHTPFRLIIAHLHLCWLLSRFTIVVSASLLSTTDQTTLFPLDMVQLLTWDGNLQLQLAAQYLASEPIGSIANSSSIYCCTSKLDPQRVPVRLQVITWTITMLSLHSIHTETQFVDPHPVFLHIPGQHFGKYLEVPLHSRNSNSGHVHASQKKSK